MPPLLLQHTHQLPAPNPSNNTLAFRGTPSGQCLLFHPPLLRDASGTSTLLGNTSTPQSNYGLAGRSRKRGSRAGAGSP